MDLKEELKGLTGKKRRFVLLRISNVGATAALQLCGSKRGNYNNWLKNDSFIQLYRRIDEFRKECRQEALQLIRKDNQLQAVLLEEKIIHRMREEIDSGEYVLIRTNLAKEVYSHLLGDVDTQTQTQTISWEERIRALNLPREPALLTEGGNDEQESTSEESQEQAQLETVSVKKAKYCESRTVSID